MAKLSALFLLVSLLVAFSESHRSGVLFNKLIHKRHGKAELEPCVDHINDLRKRHGAEPLTWGKYEARNAQAWAKHINEVRTLTKDPQEQASDKEGELLTRITTGKTPVEKCILAVNQWYSQFAIYKSAGGCGSEDGVKEASDFSRLVWKSAYVIGLGVAGDIVDARVFPPGNFEEEFAEDVQC